MKLILGILVVVIGVISGNLLGEKFTTKKLFYKDHLDFIQTMIRDVAFTQSTIKTILHKYTNGLFGQIAYEYIVNKNHIPKIKFLSDEELTNFIDFLDKVGKSDVKTQLDFLNSNKILVEKYYESAEKDEKRYKKLYIKLGF